MRRTHLATFERKTGPDNQFDGTNSTWNEITKEWISINPLTGSEFQNASQTTATQKFECYATHSPTMATVAVRDRMKVKKTTVVNEQEPDADENFRIFEIDSIVNVREQNRELLLTVTERV